MISKEGITFNKSITIGTTPTTLLSTTAVVHAVQPLLEAPETTKSSS